MFEHETVPLAATDVFLQMMYDIDYSDEFDRCESLAEVVWHWLMHLAGFGECGDSFQAFQSAFILIIDYWQRNYIAATPSESASKVLSRIKVIFKNDAEAKEALSSEWFEYWRKTRDENRILAIAGEISQLKRPS